MNEQPEGNPTEPRRVRPRREAGEQPEGGQPDALALLRDSQPLARLRERVQSAAHEIVRLREENAALAERIARLEAVPAEAATVIRLDEDPEALRRKVTGFIEAIDEYLAREQP